MQKPFLILLSCLTLFATNSSHATRSRISKRTVFVQGRLIELQKDVAVLEQKRHEGKIVRFRVPKATLPSWDGFVVGKAELIVPVAFSDLIELNSLKVALQDDPDNRAPSSKKTSKRTKSKKSK